MTRTRLWVRCHTRVIIVIYNNYRRILDVPLQHCYKFAVCLTVHVDKSVKVTAVSHNFPKILGQSF